MKILTKEEEIILLEKIQKKIPDVIIDTIKSYLLTSSCVFLTKNNYINQHYCIRNLIPRSKTENYMRDMVKRDNDFVFIHIVNENYDKWIKMKHYIYKNVIYKNYFYFMKDFCIENESHKCRILLTEYLNEHGLCQNQHKNNIYKNKRWKI